MKFVYLFKFIVFEKKIIESIIYENGKIIVYFVMLKLIL